MTRTNSTFSSLQAVAVVATLAVTLWSVGVPAFRFAEAANVTSFSNTLSDSAPTAASNHTLSFETPSGMIAGQAISISFDPLFTNIGGLDALDLDLNINGVEASLIDTAASGVNWNVNAAGSVINITSDTEAIATGTPIIIRIGTNATSGGTGTNQIDNPAVGSYEITVAVGSSDSGATRVAIVDAVTVTAAVETIFEFTVLGVLTALPVNGDTTTITSDADAIAFGVLIADTLATAAQDLEVRTNAANGFVVTVQTDQQLTSANGSDIDGFVDGAFTTIPALWAPPSQTLSDDDTYGHWGITTDDDTVTPSLGDEFGTGLYVSASSTPVEVFRHNGPTNGTGLGIGLTRVGYSVEISDLQEAGDDYTATLTYVATPVF